MDELYELMNQSIIASPEVLTFGVAASICVAAAILWLRYTLKSRRPAMNHADPVRPITPVFFSSEEQGDVGSSGEPRQPFGGIQAALRRARANDVEKKASPVKDRENGSSGEPQSSDRVQVPVPPVSVSLSVGSRGSGAEAEISKPPARDAEETKYPSAFTAIEYREDIRKVWEAIGQLTEFVRHEFLSALEKDPQIDARDLAATILRKLEEERKQFDSSELKDAYRAAAQISKDAADEFRRVVVLLGATVDPDKVLAKIREKYADNPDRGPLQHDTSFLQEDDGLRVGDMRSFLRPSPRQEID